MGWPFEEASWNEISGAIYMGLGGSMPVIWTLLAAALCVIAIIVGMSHELSAYKRITEKNK